MRTHIYRLLLLGSFLVPFAGHAQDDDPPRALFDSVDVSGGFFSFNMRYTEVMRTGVVLLGFNGGVVLNDRFNVGLGGAFSSSVIKNNAYEAWLVDSAGVDTQAGLQMRYGYGGLLLEPVLVHRSAVHLTLPVLVGAGGVSYGYPLPGTDSSDRRSKVAGQAFFAFEPGMELEVSLLRQFRIGFGVSYLYTSDLRLPHTDPAALRTLMYRLTLKLTGG